jgi:hypothetical protein
MAMASYLSDPFGYNENDQEPSLDTTSTDLSMMEIPLDPFLGYGSHAFDMEMEGQASWNWSGFGVGDPAVDPAFEHLSQPCSAAGACDAHETCLAWLNASTMAQTNIDALPIHDATYLGTEVSILRRLSKTEELIDLSLQQTRFHLRLEQLQFVTACPVDHYLR